MERKIYNLVLKTPPELDETRKTLEIFISVSTETKISDNFGL
jgi:hypothetical protein